MLMMKGDDYDYDDGDGDGEGNDYDDDDDGDGDDEGNDTDGDGDSFYEVLAGGDVWTGRLVKRNRRGTKYFFFFGETSMGEVERKLL